MSDKTTIESLEASIKEASLKHLQSETAMQEAIRELRESSFDVEKLNEKLSEYGERLRGIGVADEIIKGLVQEPVVCGGGPYRGFVTKLYEETVINDEKVIYRPIVGGAFAFVRLINIGWGVLLKKDINRYVDNIRASNGMGGADVRILTYENLLHLTLKHIKDMTGSKMKSAEQFKIMVSVASESDDQESVFEEKKS